jgi:hypothetical protein
VHRWDEGDIDDDGKIDYFYYIDDHPVTLDEYTSDDLDMAPEVDIAVPPSQATVSRGTCQQAQAPPAQCTGDGIEVDVQVAYVIESASASDVFVWADSAAYPPPPGIEVHFGGDTSTWYESRILWSPGGWIEASTSNEYSAIGVQVQGNETIGWARVLFDGVEIWQGNMAAQLIDPIRHGAYVEVRCFSPGEHRIRVEALGIDGGGGMSVPVAYFGFRP